MKLTIKDIARMAGVSVSTVSKCINGYHDIGEETRQKVQAIMEETGFKPNFSARSLISKRTHMIGVIFGHQVNYDFGHPHYHYTEVLNAFKKAIGRLGYDILLFSNELFHSDREDYLARCEHYKVDGCLIFASTNVIEAVRSLDRSDIPCVGIDLMLRGSRSANVRVDNVLIGSLAAAHLLDNGHTDIGYIGSRWAEPVYTYRERGLRSRLEEAGLPLRQEWIAYADDQTEQGGHAAARQLLAGGSLPTAVFAGADLLAIGAIRAFKEAGVRVPEQLSVIGCDNIEACRFIEPPLTSVSQSNDMIGDKAAEILHRLIIERDTRKGDAPSGQPAQPAATYFVEPEIAARETVMRLEAGSRTGAP